MVDSNRSGRTTTRREVLRILAVGGTAALAGGGGLLLRSRDPRVARSRVLMGTTVSLTVIDRDREAALAAATAALDRMAALEALLSRYRDDSEVSLLNRTGLVRQASTALLDVLDVARRVHRLGDGAFDVTVQPVLDLYRTRSGRRHDALPDDAAIELALDRVGDRRVRVDGTTVRAEAGTRVTLDGVGKGYVVDRGVDELRGRGYPNVLVEAGGDLVAAGRRDGEPWRIGIRAPRRGLALQASFDATDRAVATSGDSIQSFTPDHRRHHIVDPRTGHSAPELASATVVAADAATADALATLTLVLGSVRGRALLEALPDCEGYLVSKALEVTRTTGWTGR